ncbi:glycoside hydrolase family 3 N-terminal domain-containing protein [uncultured Muribaculum sp.]|uniref:glycoside hydrolase family 3 N-terminal domain-containing protein n=1 Tax=uncultured Muribaculum sp. TaxID=1918613 RepID=UPI0025DE1437|nr:glycoside hydrolase family 3 N-terminal domain-containing protein [uncultured Muribaculum sp.]
MPSIHARTEKGAYLDPKLPVEQRVDDLLSRMTVEEKVGQLLCPLGWEMYEITGPESVEVSQKFRDLVKETGAGMLWATYRADPWTRKTLDNGLTPEQAARAGNAIQKYVIENTRFGIPVFLAEEAPHGHMAIGTTVFPTGLGMAATWNPQLIRSVGEVIGREVRSQGGHISYGPVLDLTRDPRWSRVEETFGEDPLLAGRIGGGMIAGLGGGDLSKPNSTIATLKHFLAYAVPEGGQNGNYSVVGKRDLLQNFLPPFKEAVDSGALSIMSSYNSIDGIPCTSNKEILYDITTDWGFNGFVVSDLYSIEGIHETHHVAPTMEDAAVMALNAGLDVDLGGDAFRNLVSAARSGKLDEGALDRAVGRVLKLKFDMGLFENPYVDPKKARRVGDFRSGEVARDVARQSITLLKNDGGVLPLKVTPRLKIALVGPNADNAYNMLGDYTAPQPEGRVVTVLDGLRRMNPGVEIEYVKGCAVRDTLTADIDAAVNAARQADVVIAVVGGSSARDFKTSYKETGAAVVDAATVSDMESGEGFDRESLSLLGRQLDLLKAVKATGKPLVVVYIEGRPLDKEWAAENADALLTAYYPGQQGGNAIAEVIYGMYNPAGRLPVTTPRSVGQIPLYYNRKAPKLHDYVDGSATPRYPFGHGLSYTSFGYSGLSVTSASDGSVDVGLTVTNTGDSDGEEVVQLYLHPEYASTVQPMMRLADFRRVAIPKGESREVHFTLPQSAFEIIGPDYRPMLQKGNWDVMVGASSADIRLSATHAL